MSNKIQTPNKNNEFLLDINPKIGSKTEWDIYDLSSFLPTHEGKHRTHYLSRVAHSIKGNKHVIHIIDFYNTLDEVTATKLAKEWYLGNTTNYRLDKRNVP